MNQEKLIDVDSVSRFYGAHCALDEVSFSVHRGEVLGFLGPNGAGKSTTMQIICGVLAASRGKVTIAGFDILEQARQAKQHIGFLPEHPPLYSDLTVDEYLGYCARLRQVPKNTLDKVLSNCKQRCGLQDHGKRLIANLSKGYQQRVGIAQAIVHAPAVIILDEPTAGLDPIQILEIRELISELAEDHSVILSTHILPEVQSSCHRVLIINRGKLVLDQALHSLQDENQYAVCTLALKTPPLLEELDRFEDLMQIDSIDKHRFRISYRRHSAVPEQLAEAAAEAGWGLFELIPEQSSLEQTFLKLTQGEAGFSTTQTQT